MIKKKPLAVTASLVCLFALSNCKGGGSSGGMISVDPLSVEELGGNFNKDYLPDKSNIQQRSGTVNVCLDFEGTAPGWKAVANEYMRLQSNQVTVNIDDTLSGKQYADKLNSELNNPSTTSWDICEGNLGYGKTRTACINLFDKFKQKNYYCGANKKWNEVVDEIAYKSSSSDTSGETFIVNSENMQSCWFINDVAFQKAVEKGYKTESGLEAYPETWNDLINLCKYMKEAGYTNPLGISLESISVESLQFTWLLRIYGDYYYRQFYSYIQKSSEEEPEWEGYDPTDTEPETRDGYNAQPAKYLNILFNENVSSQCSLVDWAGFQSDLYKDFVGNLAKMNGYLMQNSESTALSTARDNFRMQNSGKSSPQILLDYEGFGLKFKKNETESFKLGMFDYPTMKSDYVDGDTITRDIGGNGGFISIINHVGETEHNNLTTDFVEFFLSPYGQTIYYKGLAANDVNPKGLTTVNNDLVGISDEWKNYFTECEEAGVKFNGLVDPNPFISFGVRYCNGYPKTQAIIVSNWQKLIVTKQMDVDNFCSTWAEACTEDMKSICATNKWKTPDVYENFWYPIE